MSELDGVLKGRVNHTMVIRPPGAPGGSETAYTAYIFGGFDGTDRADMLNATMTIPTTTPGAINNCRGEFFVTIAIIRERTLLLL